jgi:tetratricopeptide (TPR) repeat protein
VTSEPEHTTEPGTSIRNESNGFQRHLYQIGSIGQCNIYQPQPPRLVVPRQLPPAAKPFINRRDQLSQLGSVLTKEHDGSGPRLIVVEGDHEAGKTSLVARWASNMDDAFPDGSIYCDLDDHHRDGAIDLTGVLGSLLRDLGTDESFWPADVHGRSRHWRSVTAGKTQLLVLENLDNPAWLTSLKPSSPHTTVVVTCRVNALDLIADHGAEHLSLTQLSVDHCLELLSAFGGTERINADLDTARQLVAACGGQPRMIRRVGARLQMAPTLTLRQLYAHITDDGPPKPSSTNAAAVQQLSSQALDPHARQLLDRLLHHPGNDFSTDLAAALTDRSDVNSLLKQLASAQLVAPRPGQRWQLPSSTRHALPQPFSQAADSHHRIIEFYQRAARAADFIAMDAERLRVTDDVVPLTGDSLPFVDSSQHALDWLELEIGNILAAQKLAYDHGLDAKVVAFEESLWPLYTNRKHPGDRDRSSALAVEAANRLGDPRMRSRMYAQRGRCLFETGAHSAALAEMQNARDIARSIGNRRLEASAVEFAGRVYTKQRRHVEAIQAYQFALSVNIELGLARGTALNQRFLGSEYARIGNYEQARTLLLDAYEGFRDLGSDRNLALTSMDLAKLYAWCGELDSALPMFDTAIQRLDDLGANYYIAEAQKAQGDALAQHGHRDAAIQCWQIALNIHADNNNTAGPIVAELQALLNDVD